MERRIILILILGVFTFNVGECQDKGLETSVTTSDVELGFSFYNNKQYDLAKDQFDMIYGSTDSQYTDLDKAWSLLGKGLVYFDLSESNIALEHLTELKSHLEEFDDGMLSFYTFRYISSCYVNLGDNSLAEDHIRLAIIKAPENELPYVQNELVRILVFLDKKQEAGLLASENISLLLKMNDSFGICVGYTTLGQTLFRNGKDMEGLNAWKNCFDYALENKQYEAVVWITTLLSNYYRANSNLEVAYRYLRYNTLYKDSVQVENSRIQLEVEAARSLAINRQQLLLNANLKNEEVSLSLQT